MIVGWIVENGASLKRIAVRADQTTGVVEVQHDGDDKSVAVDGEDSVDDLIAALTSARDVLWPRLKVERQ